MTDNRTPTGRFAPGAPDIQWPSCPQIREKSSAFVVARDMDLSGVERRLLEQLRYQQAEHTLGHILNRLFGRKGN